MSTLPAKRGRTRVRKQIPPIRALERGCAVLEVVAEAGGATLSEVARATELSVSTTFRVLETLRQRGYVEQVEATARYHLGFRAAQLGAHYAGDSPLPKVAYAPMRKLVDDVNETANLAILDDCEAVYVRQVEAQHAIRMFTQPGARAPLHCTGVGKILLAWRPWAEVERLLERVGLKPFTPATITTLAEFQAELDRVRKRGFAVDDEEREPGVRCVTAPVRNGDGAVVAALSISGPTMRFTKRMFGPLSKHVIQAANETSSRLGYAMGHGKN